MDTSPQPSSKQRPDRLLTAPWVIDHIIIAKTQRQPTVHHELVVPAQIIGELPSVGVAQVGTEPFDIDAGSEMSWRISIIEESAPPRHVMDFILWMQIVK